MFQFECDASSKPLEQAIKNVARFYWMFAVDVFSLSQKENYRPI